MPASVNGNGNIEAAEYRLVDLDDIGGGVTPRPGDANCDGVVDNADLQAVLDTWASATGDPDYDAGADLNDDGAVDNVDLQLLLDNWARSCS